MRSKSDHNVSNASISCEGNFISATIAMFTNVRLINY